MATPSVKGDLGSGSQGSDSLEMIHLLQLNMQQSECRMQRVEETVRSMSETHTLLDGKLDGIYKILQQMTSSDFGSAEKSPRPISNTTPIQSTTTTLLTAVELAYLKKQEAAGKISLHHSSYIPTTPNTTEAQSSPSLTFHIPDPTTSANQGIVYTHILIEPTTHPNPSLTHQTPPNSSHQTSPSSSNFTTPDPPRYPNLNHFSLSIARPKLDFPNFGGDEPVNWLRQCEKYFALASVPIDTWVPLATLHCQGIAQTWWSLRTPANLVHWT
jgi:hypothetical protein